jgi:hypothetical protein
MTLSLFEHSLKGQCHEIFCFWFFSWISFPQASDYTTRAVSIFTPVANLPPASLIPVEKFATGVADTGGKFATGVVDTGGAPWLANISANFRKNSKRSKWNTLGLGETDSWKKPEAKNLVTLSL